MQPESTMEICRLCLHSNSENLVPVLNDTFLLENIKQFTSIEISENEDLPTRACNFCVKQIQNWVTFRANCIKSNKLLIDLQQQKYENENFEQNAVIYYSCEMCQENFSTSEEFLEHQETHNEEPESKCDIFEEALSMKPFLQCDKEVFNIKIDDTDKFKCSHCSNTYSTEATLDEHIKIKHCDLNNLTCEICCKQLYNSAGLRRHLLRHSNEKLFKCNQCAYKGNTSDGLSTHKLTHLNENCICEICSKSFNCRRRLNEHLKRMHPKEKTHECNFCDQKFGQNYLLTRHLKMKHRNSDYKNKS